MSQQSGGSERERESGDVPDAGVDACVGVEKTFFPGKVEITYEAPNARQHNQTLITGKAKRKGNGLNSPCVSGSPPAWLLREFFFEVEVWGKKKHGKVLVYKESG